MLDNSSIDQVVKRQLLDEQIRSLQILRQLWLFSNIDGDSLRTLAEASSRKFFSKGSTVARQGEIDNYLFVLASGNAKIVRTLEPNKEIFVDEIFPGNHFGELSIVDGKPHSTSVRCTTRSEVLLIKRDAFIKVIAREPELRMRILQCLTSRLHFSYNLINALALPRAYERILQRLSLLDSQSTHDAGVNSSVRLSDLAAMLGTSSKMIQKPITRLKFRGRIEALPNGQVRLSKVQERTRKLDPDDAEASQSENLNNSQTDSHKLIRWRELRDKSSSGHSSNSQQAT